MNKIKLVEKYFLRLWEANVKAIEKSERNLFSKVDCLNPSKSESTRKAESNLLKSIAHLQTTWEAFVAFCKEIDVAPIDIVKLENIFNFNSLIKDYMGIDVFLNHKSLHEVKNEFLTIWGK